MSQSLTLAHSPDPDDAFMWWALVGLDSPRFDTGGIEFKGVMVDIETLNRESEAGKYDITAISCAQYPYVANTYAITSCGASFGEKYGPKLVANRPAKLRDIRQIDAKIAIPGDRTTAALLTAMMLECSADRFVAVSFEDVIERVASGEFDFGVVIHEGQLTFAESGLHLIADVGKWWFEETDFPLPLGLNVIRRSLVDDLGQGGLERVTRLLRQSIDFAMDHRARAVDYSMQYARGVSPQQADQFVRMYVNNLTLDCGIRGARAIETLLSRGGEIGWFPSVPDIDVIKLI